MNQYKKCTARPYSLLGVDSTFASDDPLRYKNNLLEKLQKLIITIDDKIRDGKLQNDINRKTTKIKVDKYEYLTVEKILPSDQRRVPEQAKFSFSSLGKL